MITLGDIELSSPIMNAAGIVKSYEDVVKFAKSSVSAVVVGSITVEPRAGNSGTTYYIGNGYSLNSLGLPNPGMEYYKSHLKDMLSVCHDNGKPLILSVAGFTLEDYATLCVLAAEKNVDALEVNLGCPNVWDDGKQHEIWSYNYSLVEEIAACVPYNFFGKF